MILVIVFTSLVFLLIGLLVGGNRIFEGLKGGGGVAGGGGGRSGDKSDGSRRSGDRGSGTHPIFPTGEDPIDLGSIKWGIPYWSLFGDWYYPNWNTCNQKKVINNCQQQCEQGQSQCNDCFTKNC
jgi:hypothetical protein